MIVWERNVFYDGNGGNSALSGNERGSRIMREGEGEGRLLLTWSRDVVVTVNTATTLSS